MSKQQQHINDIPMDAGKDDEKWDAAALLDGVYFDPQLHYDQQRERAATEGLIGVARMTNTVALLDASRIARSEGGMNAVVATFRDMKTGARWNPAPASVSHTRFFSKFPGKENEALRKDLTVERIGTIRDAFPKQNPAQPGFIVNRHDTITLRFDDLVNVQDPRALVALLILAGFEFVLDREPEKYVVFVSGEGQPFSKGIVTLRCTKRVQEAISGVRPFLLNNYPVSVRVYTINCVQKGRVLKLEGPICKWIKKMITLGIPLQQVLWKIADCLILQGLRVRSVYLDDEGFKKRFISVESSDFDVRVEFFSKEQADVDLIYFSTKLVSEKHTIFEDKFPQDSLIKVVWKLSSFVVRALQSTHPYCLVMNVGEGAQSFRMLVEEALGTSSEAATIAYVESYFKRKAPHLQLGVIQPDVYGDDQVNFKKVRIHFEKQESLFKALLAIYSVVASRSEAFRANRLDFSVRDGEPFNDITCEVWDGNRQIRKYKERGEKDDSERKNDLDKRGWESDPINYFNQTWLRKVITSPYEARVRKQAIEREAGMKREIPMIGASIERIKEREDGEEDDDYDPDAPDTEGDALLASDPVHGNFWFFEEPYTPPALRTEPQPNPFLESINWHRTLYRVSPELILCEEWEHLQLEVDMEHLVKVLLLAIAQWGQPFWAPAPGYNCLPMQPATVPTPKKDMKGMDLRQIWDTQLWTSNPAAVYKALAKLLDLGWITQERSESGLCFEFGPRMHQDQIPINTASRTLPPADHFHHFSETTARIALIPVPEVITYDAGNPREYLWGEGNELNDDDAMLTARKIMSHIDDRGVLCFPASRYGETRIPSTLTRLSCADEDNFGNFIRTHVEYEVGHLGCIIQYILSTKRATQVLSPRAGGVYLLSEDEQTRRVAAGIKDEDYAPIPWDARTENHGIVAPMSSGAAPSSAEKQARMEVDVAAPQKPAPGSAVKRSIQMGDSYVSSGHFEYLQHHVLLKALDITVPREVRRQLRHIVSNLIPATPQVENIAALAHEPAQAGQAHQDIARIALINKLDSRIQLELAEIATDMQRLFTVRQQLRQAIQGQSITDNQQRMILASCERPGFFSRIRTKLAALVQDKSLDAENQVKLSGIMNEEHLIQLSQTEVGGTGSNTSALAVQASSVLRWDFFLEEARAQINSMLSLPGIQPDTTAMLCDALNEIAVTVDVDAAMSSMLDGTIGAEVLFVRIASLAKFVGPTRIGAQIGQIAVNVRKMTTCQSNVINATQSDKVPREIRDMAFAMARSASFYTAVSQWLLESAYAANQEQRAQIMLLLHDENVVCLTNGEPEKWRGLDLSSLSASPPLVAPQPLTQPSLSGASSDSPLPSNGVKSMADKGGVGGSTGPDFQAMMLTQLAGIAATPGVTPHAISLLEQAGADLSRELPLADMLETVKSSSDRDSIQNQLAVLALEQTMEMPIRIELAHIAIDLFKALRCQERAVFATSHAGNTEAVRLLSTEMGYNRTFFDSIKTRIEIASGNKLMSVQQCTTVARLATEMLAPTQREQDSSASADTDMRSPDKTQPAAQSAASDSQILEVDFLTVIRTQLAGIAATSGISKTAIEHLQRIGVELGSDYPLEDMLTLIKKDSAQEGSVQGKLAKIVSDPSIDPQLRTDLSQIAADLYKIWKCQSGAVFATSHPSNPDSSRVLSAAMGSNPTFYRSIQLRLEQISEQVSLSAEQRAGIISISRDPKLIARVEGAKTDPSTPQKGRRNRGKSGSPSKQRGGKLEKDKKDKNAVRDDPLARPPAQGRGKP